MKYDVAIIGGGPAGMMAGGRAGELGFKVVLLEKNSKLGIKFISTGGGRANLTNLKSDRALAEKFGENGKFLLSGFSKFGPEELLEFFNSRGLKTKVEDENRVFPESNLANDALKILLDYLKAGEVEVKFNSAVKKIIAKENKIEKVILNNNTEIIADNFIICAGGKARPATGSTGDAYTWLKQLGHTIIEPRPALTPIILKDKFIKDLEGLSLKGVKICCFKKDKRVCSGVGSAIFTSNGISGPTILNLSEVIGREDLKDLILKIDFFPELDFTDLDKKLQQEFASGNSLFKNALSKLVQPKLVETMVKLSGIKQDKKLNLITKEERKTLIHLLKEFNLSIAGLESFDKAIVTAGGVDLKEVDPKTMKSKIISNLYLAGEILNLTGPTGGYNLQLCWTTGYVAGDNFSNN
jgi:hypothetical protein